MFWANCIEHVVLDLRHNFELTLPWPYNKIWMHSTETTKLGSASNRLCSPLYYFEAQRVCLEILWSQSLWTLHHQTSHLLTVAVNLELMFGKWCSFICWFCKVCLRPETSLRGSKIKCESQKKSVGLKLEQRFHTSKHFWTTNFEISLDLISS